jgi:hypothetical protein
VKESVEIQFQKAFVSGMKKKHNGDGLRQSEEVAIKGEWYFTLPLPVKVIDRIIEDSERKETKPSEIVRAMVMEVYGE